jgi:predicted nucleic acid-binding protein
VNQPGWFAKIAMIRIVDASAIGAVLLVEPEASWVHAQTEGMELLAPVILPFEVGNLCWKRSRLSPSDAENVVAVWAAWSSSLPVRLVMPSAVHTLRLAYETGLTFYDASYLRVAQEHAAAIVSLNARLVRTARDLGVVAPSPGTRRHTTPRSRN